MSQLNNMMDQIKKLKNGVGVQSLLDSAYQILGNPITMFNIEYSLMAYTKVMTDDPIWNELITFGALRQETQMLFQQEGFIEDMTNATRITVMTSEKLKYDRINGKLFNKNNSYVSNLMIVGCEKPFEENDLFVFGAVCSLISREISKNEFYQEYEQSHQETVIKKLIEGNYDIKLDMAQVAIIYDSLESNLYVAVADLSARNGDYKDITYFRDLFKKIQPAYKYAIYSDYIIIIISTYNEMININQEMNELLTIFAQNNIYAGLSNRFENLFELQKHYMQARKALQYAMESKSDQRIFPCKTSSIQAMERIRALENGLGIQYYLDIAPEILGNPVIFHDMELKLLSCTENIEVGDPVWEELVTYGTCSNETIEFLKTEGFISLVENTKAGALLISDMLTHNRISGKIYNHDNIMVGCLCMVASNKPFEEDALALFGSFCQKFSKEIAEIEFYNKYGQAYSETVISRLLDGKIDDYTFFSEDIGNIYDNLMENIFLFVINREQCGSKHINLTYFREIFNQLNTVNRYAVYYSYIIIIVSTDFMSVNEKHELREINRAFEQNNIYAGISSRFGNIYELQKHYHDALNALNKGMKSLEPGSKQRIFQHKEADGHFKIHFDEFVN